MEPESDDYQSIPSVQHQTYTQIMELTRRQSKHDVADDDDVKLFSLVQRWTERGRERKQHRELLVEKLENLLQKSSPALEKTDDAGRTVLHLALLHRMPEQFILLLVERMKQSELDSEDNKGRRAVDYLLDWEDVNIEILKKFIAKRVNLSEERDCLFHKHPLVRLCQRTVDGSQMLELVCPVSISQDFKNKMLEEAVKTGSSSTVEYLLKTGADARSTSYLLHDAAKANHNSLDKLRLLTQNVDPSQVSEEGLTLVHVAAGGKPPNTELLLFVLEKGVDPNKQDVNGDTALHKVTKNYSERKVPWKRSEQTMKILLRHTEIDPNIANSRGLTPLGTLMSSRGTLPDSLLWLWLKAGADFTGSTGSDESDLGNRGLKSLLAEISRRSDGHDLIKSLIRRQGVGKLLGHLKYMLEAAVDGGSADTVKVLLDNGANANEDNGRLLMIAARSNTDADGKLRSLLEKGADPSYRDPKGFSVLHEVAQSSTATENVLKACTSHPNVRFDWNDRCGNTPLHIAARSTHSCSDKLLGNLSEHGDVNKLNATEESPLRLVLQYNHSNKELRRNKVVLLLVNGCKPTKEDFERYEGDADDFQNLFLSTVVLTKTHEPFLFFLVLAKYCGKRLEVEKKKVLLTLDWTQTQQWTDLNGYKIEDTANKMIEESGKRQELDGWEMTIKEFQYIHELEWKKFLSNKNVGIVLERTFFGHIDISTTGKRWRMYCSLPWLIFVFLLRCLLFPISILIKALCAHCKCDKLLYDPRRLPIVTFYSSMVSYMVFLGLVIAHVTEDSPHRFFSLVDWILLLYVVAMVAEEVYQIKNQRRRYVTVTNGCDVLMILCFFMFFVFRVIGFATDSLRLYRVSEYVFAVAAALSFLRLLHYIQVIRKLGPILFSFKAIYKEVVSFMTILVIMLFAFAIAVTVVYNGGVYTQEFQNGNISLPHLVSGVWPTLQLLYWSLYGQIEFRDLESEHDVLYPEMVFGKTLFALWCLVSAIVLLNMLIALIDEAFDKVKRQNANLVWNLAVYNIIKDIEELPSFPLPINLFYFISLAFKMNMFEEEREETPRAKRAITKQSDKANNQRDRMAPNMEFIAELQPEEDRTMQTLKCVGALELQVSSLKTELSRGMKILRCQTKKRFSKQTKRVRTCLRLLQSRPADNPDTPDGHTRGKDSDCLELAIESDSDSDSDTDSDCDVDKAEQLQVRHECVSYDASHISYEGNGDQVGGCQFLSKPMSRTFQYFEVKVVDYGRNGSIGVGLAHSSYPLHRMPGLSKGSVAYHCDNGQLFIGHRRGSDMVSPAQQADIIGCGIKCYVTSNGFEDSPVVFFTRNGRELGRKKVKFPKTGFFPIVGLRSQGAEVEVDWNAEWKSSEDVDQSNIVREGEFDFVVLQQLANNPISPNGLLSDDLEIESDSDATRPTSEFQDSHLVRRSELVCAMGNNMFKYGSDIPRGVGVYQSLIRPMSPEFSYYEVTVKKYGMNGTIAVGLALRNYPLIIQPGSKKGSIAWHCDDAGLYVENEFRRPVLYTPVKTGDIIGCGIDFEANGRTLSDRQLDSKKIAERLQVYFTHNGIRMIEETIEEPEGGLFPTVSMHSPGEEVEINLSVFTSTVPTFLRQARAERVAVEGNFVSFVSNTYNDVGGIQLMQRNMKELEYFEVTIISTGDQNTIRIGVAYSEYPLNCQPGWGDGSIAFCCKDGFLSCNGEGERFSHSSVANDVIGCGIRYDFDQLQVFFTHNGKRIGDQKPFLRLPPTELYPTVCMHSQGEKVKINVHTQWSERREKPLFYRLNRIKTDGNKAFYASDADTEVGVVQLTREICKEYPYFEVEVTGFGEKGNIGVGLAPGNYRLDSEPGWRPGSVGYHCNDGCLFEGVFWKGKPIRPPGRQGDRIGCGLKYPENIMRVMGDKVVVFFTHNEEEVCQSEVKWPSRSRGLLPTIGMQGRGEAITVIEDARWPRHVSPTVLDTPTKKTSFH